MFEFPLFGKTIYREILQGYLIFALWVGLIFNENEFQSISGFQYITSSLYDSQLES